MQTIFRGIFRGLRIKTPTFLSFSLLWFCVAMQGTGGALERIGGALQRTGGALDRTGGALGRTCDAKTGHD